MKKEIEQFDRKIDQLSLKIKWGDSLFEVSEQERQIMINEKYNKCLATFTRIMRSSKNDGSSDYREWAIKKSLELKTSKGYTAQAIGGKNWQSWSKR